MNERRSGQGVSAFLVGTAAAACLFVIFGGVLAAVLMLLLRDWSAMSLCLIAVGGTAGLVLNAALRQ